MSSFMDRDDVYRQSSAPVAHLKTNRGLLKLILLSIITFGIYAIVFFCSVTKDINLIASRYDGKKTMHYALLIFLIAPLTGGIGALVWHHRMANRIGGELERRLIGCQFDASTFWLWGILGSLIIVGPFFYLHKLCDALNLLSEHYNNNG